MSDAENLVLEHSKYLLASGIYSSKQEAVEYAMKKCLPAMYFRELSQMYDILIREAEENFIKNILEKL
jgi:hypothetical protein